MPAKLSNYAIRQLVACTERKGDGGWVKTAGAAMGRQASSKFAADEESGCGVRDAK